MADLNEVRLIGRLTRDPIMKTFPSGSSLTTFGLATSKKFKDQGGALKEETTFVDVSCWGKLGEVVSRFLKKGRLAYIGGRLKYESWDDKQTGQKRSKLAVVAEDVQFLDSRRDDAPVSHEEAFPTESQVPGKFQEDREPGDEASVSPTPNGHWPNNQAMDETPPF